MKTLYAADLDGTLLAPGAVLSRRSEEALSRFLACGITVTAATARTPATVIPIFSGTGLNAPAALMNGVLLFDLPRKQILSALPYSAEEKSAILSLCESWPVSVMVYSLFKNSLRVFFRKSGFAPMVRFISERTGTPYKTWHEVKSYSEPSGSEVIYIAALGAKEALSEMEKDIKKATSLRTALYREVNFEGVWVLEAFSRSATKAAAIKRSAEICGADRIVAFGDNLNDLPLFEGCDVSVAVANAVPDVIKAADFVCGANTADGVVEWIARDAGISL